jgi:hypothetical protein
VHEAHAALGLELPWGGYAAARIAPMGPVGPEVATAVFYGFAPSLLHGALPAAWQEATPEEVLAATTAAIDTTLAPLVAGLDGEVARAAELARQAALLQPIVGRPLGAARAGVAWPDRPHLRLWEAATRIRETRGDGHVAVLVNAGIDGCGSHLSYTGDGEKVRRALQARRGWTDAEWEAAIERLHDRGLLDGDGQLTDAGRDLREAIEMRTDALTVPAWRAFGERRSHQLLDELRPITRAVADAGILPGVVTRRVTDPRTA